MNKIQALLHRMRGCNGPAIWKDIGTAQAQRGFSSRSFELDVQVSLHQCRKCGKHFALAETGSGMTHNIALWMLPPEALRMVR